MNDIAMRKDVLRSLGADAPTADELLRYNENVFLTPSPLPDFPLPDEAFVPVWEQYSDECTRAGGILPLMKYLVQLRFPIVEGMSRNADYLAATKKAKDPQAMSSATGLGLRAPERCRVVIHSTLAGRIPLLIVGEREDFVALMRALTHRSEPVPIPDSMGACMVAGFNNLHRIRLLRERWEHENPAAAHEAGWQLEFEKIIPRKELYQDRFIILSEGPYSNVAALDLGLLSEEWRELSLVIRREHECTHYFTRRVFSKMRNNLMDELIADYAGIVAVRGAYSAEWFLRFMGLERHPQYREGGRFQNFRGEPALTDNAFALLGSLVKSAAESVEKFDHAQRARLRDAKGRAYSLLALASLTLEELASADGDEMISRQLASLEARPTPWEQRRKPDPAPACAEN